MEFEYNDVSLYRLDGRNMISNFTLPYRAAFYTFLNSILNLNGTDKWQLTLPSALFQNSTDFNL